MSYEEFFLFSTRVAVEEPVRSLSRRVFDVIDLESSNHINIADDHEPSLVKVQGEGQMVRIWVKSANGCVETSCVDWSWFCRYSAPDLAAVSTFAICIICIFRLRCRSSVLRWSRIESR